MHVFISYTHESQEHNDRVWELSAALRHDGVDCTIDQYIASPPEGWPRWCKHQIRESQFVLVVATETYARRYEGKDELGEGLGAKWEGFVITQELYEAEGRNSKFIPVVFSGEEACHIPLELRGATRYDLSVPDNYDSLFRHLTNQPARIPPPVASQIRQMPPLETHADLHFKPLVAPKRQLSKPLTAVNSCTGSLVVNIFDGTRQPMAASVPLLVVVRDGNQNVIVSKFFEKPAIVFHALPFYDNYGDNYTVIASAHGYIHAGFFPIKIAPNTTQHVDLMLVPRGGTFNFHDALWPGLKQKYPALAALLAHGATADNAAQARYTDLLENRPASLASFFNLATAMSAINLPVGCPVDYIKEVIWDDSFAQDRFFGWADPRLIDQIQLAAAQGVFAQVVTPSLFHPGATSSWKQIQFGEANVQLTFHEGETKQIDGINCVKIGPNIDYYKDLGAHLLLEVVVNTVSNTLTDPRQVYALRWMAGRHAGVTEFNPPYTIV